MSGPYETMLWAIESVKRETFPHGRPLSNPIPREDDSLLDISIFDIEPTETQSTIQGSKGRPGLGKYG